MLSDNLTPMVLRVLAREGKTVTLVQPARQEELTYDPSTGETSVVADSTCSVKAVVLDFALVSNGMQSKAGTTITIDDKNATCHRLMLMELHFLRHFAPTIRFCLVVKRGTSSQLKNTTRLVHLRSCINS